MTVGTLPVGAQGGDSDSVCDLATAKALYAARKRFLLRYISRTTPQNRGDLTGQERAVIRGAGLAVGYVQHFPGDGWRPSAAQGAAWGQAAVVNLRSIGASPGVCVWRDWEGLHIGSQVADGIADANAWNAAVVHGGYAPGIYFGYDGILDAQQLYHNLTCRHYWKSASRVPAPAVRGWQMTQTLGGSPVSGYDWDSDVIVRDALGGLPLWDMP